MLLGDAAAVAAAAAAAVGGGTLTATPLDLPDAMSSIMLQTQYPHGNALR